MQAYNEARLHEKATQSHLLMTAHSSKGLEVDEVTIADDLNLSIAQTIELLKEHPNMQLTDDQLGGLYLYYVACTRASVRLNNALHLQG